MDEKADRFACLIAAYLQEKLTDAEEKELFEWVESSEENMLLFEDITDEKNVHDTLQRLQAIDKTTFLKEHMAQFAFTEPAKTRRLWPYAAAAAAILMIA